MTTNTASRPITESQARETLHWLDAADATERGWWYRDASDALEIVESGTLTAESSIDSVLDALRSRGLVAEDADVSDEQLKELCREALIAGDVGMAELCNSALRGDVNHRAHCAHVIASAKAMDDE
jgi:hypothetical protein